MAANIIKYVRNRNPLSSSNSSHSMVNSDTPYINLEESTTDAVSSSSPADNATHYGGSDGATKNDPNASNDNPNQSICYLIF
jgi:hypothetical protein